MKYNFKLTIISIIVLNLCLPGIPMQAAGGLTFGDLEVEVKGVNATVSWTTNRNASGCVDFGLNEGSYDFSLCAVVPDTFGHKLQLINLEPDETYHFRIRSVDIFGGSVTSFDQTFKSGEMGDFEKPEISDVRVLYVTGTTATIFWRTNEPADSRIDYGLFSDFGKKKTSGSKVIEHELTLKGLTADRTYFFKITSKDKDGNIVVTGAKSFKTLLTEVADKAELKISNVKPVEVGDARIGATTARITWQTNKLADSKLRWGTKQGSHPNNLKSSLPRNFFHEFSITELEPSTQYYFKLENKDVFSKTVKSEEFTFRTLSAGQDPGSTSVEVQAAVLSPFGATSSQVSSGRRLVQLAGSPDFYLVDKNKKHRIVSPAVLQSYQAAVPSGGVVSQIELNQMGEVRLVKTDQSNTVYFLYLRQGLKKKILNPLVFTSYPNNRWDDIVTVTQSDLDRFEEVMLVKTQDNPTVYKLDGNQRRPIPSAEIFTIRGYDWADIATINQPDLESYSLGAPIN